MATDLIHGNFTVRLYATDEGAIGSGQVRGCYCGHPIVAEDPSVTGTTPSLYSTADDAEAAAQALAIPIIETLPDWKPN